jgi:hypothetical protein
MCSRKRSRVHFRTDGELMKTRDDSPYIWAALNRLDFADFGQLSPAEQSLVLMRAAQIQQTDRGSILLERDYREHRFSGFHRHFNATPTKGENNGKYKSTCTDDPDNREPPREIRRIFKTQRDSDGATVGRVLH